MQEKYKPEAKHPLGLRMEMWWKEHGFNQESEQWHRWLEAYYGRFLGEKIDELAEKHDNKGKLGISGAGGCTKKSWIKWCLNKVGVRIGFEGSTHWTFMHGHNIEAMILATLAVGFPEIEIVETQFPVEGEYNYSTADALIIYNGVRMLLSCKSKSYKASSKSKGQWRLRGFPALVANGVYNEDSFNWMQSQVEMGLSTVDKTLYICAAKDFIQVMKSEENMISNGSMSFYVEQIPFVKNHFDQWEEAMTYTNLGRYIKYYIEEGEGKYTERISPDTVNKVMAWSAQRERYLQLHQQTKTSFKKRKPEGFQYNACLYCDLKPHCYDRIVGGTGLGTMEIGNPEPTAKSFNDLTLKHREALAI